MNETLICVPGQRLCFNEGKYFPGHGTYEKQHYIYASLAGTVKIVLKDTVQVVQVHNVGSQTVVPEQGDVVTAVVTIITLQFCKCVINCIGDTVLSRPYRAILRREDIRATEKDRIEVYKNFRPGDVILARVLPVTEAHTFHLSTGENELGVVMATSEHGYPMIPISWTQMQCSKTRIKENRKVAKVIPEDINQIDISRLHIN